MDIVKLSTAVDYTANEELQVKHESARNQGARPEEACATRPIPAAMVVPTSRTYHSKAPPPPFLHALASDQQRLTIHHHGSIFSSASSSSCYCTTLAR